MTDTTTLMTKVLLPRRRDDVLTRQRLLNGLYDMVDYRLALVSAPAGYGKTTLLVDFATDLDHPVCWYALDASDHDPRIFLERLVMSIQRRFPDFGDETLRALEAGVDMQGGAPGIVRVLVNEIVSRIPRWFVLVLDDYHALGHAPDVDSILSNFVAYQRDQCLTILASRTVPNLPLIIPLVARGGVGGIGPEQMRFTSGEIRALFAHNYGVDLTLGEAAILAEQSEGWITGLLLTAYTRWQGVLQSWMRARDSHQPVYDYLTQEVFDRQPVEMQRFLGVSSTLREMNAPLCTELLGVDSAADLLQRLEVENLFVTRLEDEWYRYHHLFRQFLQSSLRRSDPEAWEALHLRAAEWFARHGQPRDAVDHLLAIGAEEQAASLMGEIAYDLYIAGQLTTLMTWREQVSDVALIEEPRLALYQSRAAYKLGQHSAALALTEIAERGYRSQDDIEGVAYASLHRCQVWLNLGKAAAALELGLVTLEMVADAAPQVAHEAHRIVGLAYVDRGDLDRAHDHLRQALTLSDAQSIGYARALARTGLAHCVGLQGRLAEAVILNREAVAIWRQVGSDAGLADELNDLGFHLYAQGAYDEAMRCYQEALALSRRTGLRRAEAFCLVSLGEMTRDLGLLEPSAAYLQEGREIADSLGDSFLAAYGLEALGLVHRAAGKYDEALETLASALALGLKQGSAYQIGRYSASLGMARVEAGAAALGMAEIEAAIEGLRPLGMPLEVHRACLYQAWALHLSGARDRALALFGTLLDDVPESAEAQVLVGEGQHARPLLNAARRAFKEHPARSKRITRLLKRIKELGTVAERLYPLASPVRRDVEPSVRVYGFGAGRVELEGEVIAPSAWASASARQLLFYILIHGACTREQICVDFWPELNAQKAKASFHTTKFRLNRALGTEVMDYDGRVYALHPDVKLWFDVAAFNEQLARWRETHDVDALQAATELYTGDFMSECYADWCERERDALRLRCMEALETLADRLLSRRQYRRAIRALRQALSIDPTRETYHQQLMRAYALSGQRSRALVQYEQCITALREHLDAAPSQFTVELYQRVLEEIPLE